MKSNLHIFLAILLLSFSCKTHTSLPQPGETLWHIAAEIGTNVDTLLQCCVGTFTTLAANVLCAPIPLSQSNVLDDGIVLTTTGASYCLSQNITGSIIISASDVTVDLNSFSLLGTIDVLSTLTNIIIMNGNIKPPSDGTDASHAAIVIEPNVLNVVIKKCEIICDGNTGSGNGRDSINNSGINTVIAECFIQAGDAGSQGNGGNGIINSGSNIQILSNTIMAGNSVMSFNTGYVGNLTDNSVTPIDLATNTPQAPISGVFNNPNGIAIAGQTAYVVNETNSNIILINIPTNTLGTPINYGFSAAGSSPIAITPDNSTAYIITGVSSVVPVDLLSSAPGSAISGFSNPNAIAITPDGATAYVTDSGLNTVIPIDIATNIPGAGISGFSSPFGIAITPDGSTAYVTDVGSNAVIPIDIATNTSGAAIFGFNTPTFIAITPDGSTAYIVNNGNNTVVPLDLSTGNLGTPIVGFDNPKAIAISLNGLAYVANAPISGPNGYVIPITILTNTIGSQIPVGQGALALALTSVSSGGYAIMQQASNSIIKYNSLIGAGSSANSSGIIITHDTDANYIENCFASNVLIGFEMQTTGTVNLVQCTAQFCADSGFDVSGSVGTGLLENCKAINNLVCGFKDNTYSSYQYIGNVGQRNDGTPANPAGDSNYCWADLAITSTFTSPSGPGAAPFYQNGRATNGTMFGISSWDNITLDLAHV